MGWPQRALLPNGIQATRFIIRNRIITINSKWNANRKEYAWKANSNGEHEKVHSKLPKTKTRSIIWWKGQEGQH